MAHLFKPGALEGVRAVVTGGGSGIGLAISQTFLELGAEVVICSRKQDRLDLALAALSPVGKVHATVCNIREPESVESLGDFVAEKMGGLDLLVNNAGGQFPSPAEAIRHKGWRAVIDTNLNGTWYVTHEMANRFFIPSTSGTIVNIVADMFRGFPGMAHTGAARAGVSNLTQTLAVEWAKYGIRINAVAPGIIQSSGLDQYPPEFLQGIAAKIPMKRVGTTEEVADLVLFLASSMAAYITGETIYVDGGSRLWGDNWEVPDHDAFSVQSQSGES
ncbi:SDR family oxidoreductase [Pontibacter sp. G13]|uniref:SDR family oxidoreductase n=1 Tax=Pontibacter sp. G13 TaxID=3074898 RepID=UPI00288B8EA3|nr:SDR family oxidoreductase [Pontibacter sp. G13]WNJ18683.1 SDR family oxidoreductase [Pontibacter sp. G13]